MGSQNCCSKVKEAMCILGNSSCAILIQIGPKRLQICSGHSFTLLGSSHLCVSQCATFLITVSDTRWAPNMKDIFHGPCTIHQISSSFVNQFRRQKKKKKWCKLELTKCLLVTTQLRLLVIMHMCPFRYSLDTHGIRRTGVDWEVMCIKRDFNLLRF